MKIEIVQTPGQCHQRRGAWSSGVLQSGRRICVTRIIWCESVDKERAMKTRRFVRMADIPWFNLKRLFESVDIFAKMHFHFTFIY